MYELKTIYEIDVKKLIPDSFQPRKHFDEESINELAQSIKELGIIQPIIFRLDENGNHMIVAGERRWRADKLANIQVIPGIFIGDKIPEIALVENILRQNLTIIEEAEAYKQLIEKFNYTHENLSKILGKQRSTISEIISLNKLPDTIKNDCRTKRSFSREKLVEIVKEKTEEEMIKIYEKIKIFALTKKELREMRRKNKENNNKTSLKIKKKEYLIIENAAKIMINRLKNFNLENSNDEKIIVKDTLLKLKTEIEKFLKKNIIV